MVTQEELLDNVMESVTNTLVVNIRDVLAATIERELTTNLTRALVESEFYRRISDDMRGGLQTIYREISTAAKPGSQEAQEGTLPVQREDADRLFNEASRQLDEILVTTQEATESIMDVVEVQIERQKEAAVLIEAVRAGAGVERALERLVHINAELGEGLVEILTTLGFQDLTGQRIKKIIAALRTIESTVVELYLSTGLLIRAREEAPEKDLSQIEAETRQVVSELKGPQRGTSQENVDDLLAQLGL
ncbi:protein phosphatase CheZ [Nitratidesulfovibrio liaohensis]|uniref:protein phosphatase CheZ n=1 Tax=Nitratidesulfovibrio liaohensis TaxID=2604158 RepID=UPI001423238E|nr:protein phosphatase CheZ [Nitratidesulfovibrio liaohensis]NHZ46768.1 protein phosphatase CheZ [Nitratidesulfovibrio liaohensis]